MKTAAVVLAVVCVAGSAFPQDRQFVFSDKSGSGQLWANLTLTYLRVGEPFLPMVIGVQNFSKQTARLGPESFHLIGPDGSRYPLADLKNLRKEYERFSQDHRIVSRAGIPVDVWIRQRRYRESNFYPDIALSRRPTVIDAVSLGRSDGMADLFYFVAPPDLAPGRPFLLEVRPKDWEVPLRLRLVLSE